MAKSKSQKKVLIIDVALMVVIAAVLGVSMMFIERVELALGLRYEQAVRVPDDDGSADYTDALKVHFVDVGQGDCTLVELPDGKTMIIDGGDADSEVSSAILTYIDDNFPQDFKYFDYAILTHPDSDHCGSLDDVLNTYPARVSYRPNVEAVGTAKNPVTDPGKADLTANAVTKDTAAYANAIVAMYNDSADFTPVVHVTDPADETQTISGGSAYEYTLTFYSPLSEKYTDWNNYSPVMILEYKDVRFALSGDAEKKNEEEFVAKVASARTDGVTDKYDAFTDDYTVHVIKAGHHGSRTSTSQAYIDAITTPEGARSAYYVISCGEGNKYGHPHSETLDRLESMGVPDGNVLRTDTGGDFMLNVRRDGEAFKLFCNGFKTEYVTAYKSIAGVRLTWPIVAWTVYAVIVVALIVHIAVYALGVKSASNGGENSGTGSGKKKSSGKRSKK